MAQELQLLKPLTVGGQELKNRVSLAPMTRARCTPTEDPMDPTNATPNDLMAEYYEQRASGGLLITEATAISELGSGWLNAPHIRTPEQVAAWKKITDRVHAKGSVIYMQLWHMGRQSHSTFHPATNKIVGPTAIKIEGSQAKTNTKENVETEVPAEMTIDEIKATIQDYATASKLAAEAGFDGVEVHAANGYLLDTFLQSSTNQRSDDYGGSPENRVRLLKEVVEAIVESGAFPINRVAVRLSPNGAFGDMGSEDNDTMFPYVAEQLNSYGLAYLHVMDGLGFGYHNKCKPVTCADIRKVYDGIIMANVGLTRDVAEGLIRSGTVDLAAFGRIYMSNPDLVERFENDWPVEEGAPYEAWWGETGAVKYTDWPAYNPKKSSGDEKKEEEKKEEEEEASEE